MSEGFPSLLIPFFLLVIQSSLLLSLHMVPPTFHPSNLQFCFVLKKTSLCHVFLTIPFSQQLRAQVSFQQDQLAQPPLQPRRCRRRPGQPQRQAQPSTPATAGSTQAHEEIQRRAGKPAGHGWGLLFRRVGGGLGPSSYRKEKYSRRLPPEGNHCFCLLKKTRAGCAAAAHLWDACTCTHTHVLRTSVVYTHTQVFFQQTLPEQPAALSSGNKALSTPCTNWAPDTLGSADICWQSKFYLVLLKTT